MQLPIIPHQMLVPSAATAHHLPHLSSGHMHSTLQFSCFKCHPAVDYAARFAFKAASQKNLMDLECKGCKVLFFERRTLAS